MASIPSSNGHGSFNLYLAVKVPSPYDEVVKQYDWEVISSDKTSTTFKYYFSAVKRGDDESAVYSLYYAMPEDVPDGNWSVDWDKSVY